LIQLELHPLGGIKDPYNDFGSETPKPLSMEAGGKDSLAGANRRFWAQHLAEDKLECLVMDLQTRYRLADCNVPGYIEVMENPNRFMDRVAGAPGRMVDMNASEQSFYWAAEVLTVMCNLYSDFVYWPFRLTIDQGFLLHEVNTRYLLENCLNSKTNPYYEFVVADCLPVIESIKPELPWLLSPLRFSNFTMAMLAKTRFSNVHICLVDRFSEYHSLNKIRKYLRLNTVLFSVVDSIILDEVEATRKHMICCLESRGSLDKVPNCMFIDRHRGKIMETPYKPAATKPQEVLILSAGEDAGQAAIENTGNLPKIADIKLWPKAKWYWNRCTFCGINHKYNTLPKENRYDQIDAKVGVVSDLVKQGCRHFWLIDEAVPPDVLEIFALKLSEQKLQVYWQVRSRIDKGFSQTICDTLAQSGLREIRMGLESANLRILQLMDKFPKDFDLGLVEKIVSRFHRSGVSVHLCTIIGFPTETQKERNETLEFLLGLKKKFPSLTFNVNKFMLDVSSKVYAEYEKFDITTLEWPCPARYFLDNIIGWDSDVHPYDSKALDRQRNSFMRQTLFPWLPSNSAIQPLDFHDLCEGYRKTLLWKNSPNEEY